MRAPMVHEQSKRWQITFWTNDGKRRQKSVGSGKKAMKTAYALKEAVLLGRITPEDLLSGESWEELLKKPSPQLTDKECAADTDYFDETFIDSYEGQPQASSSATGNQDVTQNRPSEAKTTTFKQVLEDYIRDLGARGKTRKHMKEVVQSAWLHYYPIFGENTPITAFTYLEHIVPFINYLRSYKSKKTGKLLSSSSCNRLCGYLRAIFNFAMSQDLIEKNPMQRWKKTKEVPRRSTVTLDDVAKVMDAAAPHVRWAMECSFNLGKLSRWVLDYFESRSVNGTAALSFFSLT